MRNILATLLILAAGMAQAANPIPAGYKILLVKTNVDMNAIGIVGGGTGGGGTDDTSWYAKTNDWNSVINSMTNLVFDSGLAGTASYNAATRTLTIGTNTTWNHPSLTNLNGDVAAQHISTGRVALIDSALQPAATNGWEVGSHAGLLPASATNGAEWGSHAGLATPAQATSAAVAVVAPWTNQVNGAAIEAAGGLTSNSVMAGGIQLSTNGTRLVSTATGEVSIVDGTNTAIIVTAGNITSYETPDTVFLADGITLKKSGVTFSVQNWIVDNLISLRYEAWNHWQAQSLGLQDGAGYWFSDTNGIVLDLSTNIVWMNPGYQNVREISSGGLSDLVAHYLCNDLDGSNIVDNLTTNYAVGLYTPITGKINGSIELDGTGGIVITGLTLSATQTVSMWIKLTTLVDNEWQAFFGEGQGGQNLVFGFAVVEGTLRVDAYGGGGASQFHQYNNIPITDLNWHHVAVAVGTDAAYVYLDGACDNYVWYFNAPITPASTIDLGQLSGYSQFHGSFDDVRFYNRVLTSNEVALIYNGGIGTEDSLGPTITYLSNAVLVCTNKLLSFIPASSFASALVNTTNSIAASNFVLGVSRDGTNWTDSTSVAIADTWDVSNKLVTATLWMTNQPSGSNVFARFIITNDCPLITVKGIAAPCGE